MDNRYFFSDFKSRQGDVVVLSEQESAHLVRVRRAKLGDKIVGFNGDGYDYSLKISAINKNNVECAVEKKTLNPAFNDRNIVVYLAMLKNEALTSAIDHLAELNVKKVKLFKSDRSIASLDQKKIEKLNQISIQASKQSERADIMIVELIEKSKIKEDISSIKNKFFAYENASRKIQNFSGDFAVIIGPEGGFSSEEVEYFSSFCDTISLSKLILRAEVACVVAVASLKAVENES